VDTSPAVISRYDAWPEVAFVPLADAAPSTLVLARQRETKDPLIDESFAISSSPYSPA
jgi:hypothetical protein